MKTRRFQILGLVLVVIMAVGVMGNGFAGNQSVEASDNQKIVVPQEEAVKKVVKEVGPAVVSISVKSVVEQYDWFYNSTRKKPVKGIGSGFIFDKRGYVLTNNHVISKAKEINVILTDGREFKAKVLGSDARNDIAVLKINKVPEDLPVAPLGNSDKLDVGQMAIAIGTPYDIEFQNTVTTGVVSALNRTIEGQNVMMNNVIQTDASINPGNSGGPLLNSQGEVIGINTAILGQAQGMGFAIPINTARSITDELIEHGYVRRPFIGIAGRNVDKETLNNYFGYDGKGGVYVARVFPDGPADKAGLKQGDIILEVDRDNITDMSQLQKVIKDAGIGEKVKMLVLTKEGLSVYKVEIGERHAVMEKVEEAQQNNN